MALDDALAVTFSVPGDGSDKSFLYVPFPIEASLPPGVDDCQALGFVLGGVIVAGEDDCTCHYCKDEGEIGCCSTSCSQVACPCPPVHSHVMGCVENCRQDPDWTLDDLWADPVPYKFEIVRQVFGTDDPRFRCDALVEGLLPGMGVFDLCGG